MINDKRRGEGILSLETGIEGIRQPGGHGVKGHSILFFAKKVGSSKTLRADVPQRKGTG